MKPIRKQTENQKTNANAQAKAEKVEGIRNLFETGLNEIYSAEKALAKKLPSLVENATSPELVNTLKSNLAVTEQHVSRLENIFKTAGLKATVKKSENIEGLLKETEGVLAKAQKGTALDAQIIASGQKLKQYEITSLGNLHSYAKSLGDKNVVNLLETTLNEAQKAHAALNGITASVANTAAPTAKAPTSPKKK